MGREGGREGGAEPRAGERLTEAAAPPPPVSHERGARSRRPGKTPPRLEKAAKWTLRQSLVGGSPPDPP